MDTSTKSEVKFAQPSVKLTVIPCLSPFHENDFDPDAIDLYVVLNARAGLGPLFDAVNRQPEGVEALFYRAENTVAARGDLIFAGFPKSSWRDQRVACGIFADALKQAAVQQCQKIALMLTPEQFRGNLTDLVHTLACRVGVFAQAEGSNLKLKEVQILCRVEDEERILAGLPTCGMLCATCLGNQQSTPKKAKKG